MKSSQNQKTSIAIGLTFASAFLLYLTSPTQAAITWDGDLDPTDPTTWTSSTTGYIGKSTTGTITADDASVLRCEDSYLGYNSGSEGTVTVIGIGSKWTNYYNRDLYVGYNGTGTLNAETGGQIDRVYQCYLGYNSGSTGTATVTGNGSYLASTYLYVGNSGNGTLNIEDGGIVNNNDGSLGYNSGSTGVATVTGIGSTWNPGPTLNIGESGTGLLNVKSGGLVSSLNGSVGYNSGSIGTAIVTDPGSEWIVYGDLQAGRSGTGTLSIESGGTVTSGDGTIGYNPGSTGTVTVNGANSAWTISSSLYVGYSGTGTLNIEDGGIVTAKNQKYIGYLTGSSGTVTVTGNGSSWSCDHLYVGYKGTGTLNVKDGGVANISYCYVQNGTVSVTGAGSKWVGSMLYLGSGNATLNIGDGVACDSLVLATSLQFASSATTTAICNLNGGTIQTTQIVISNGIATFNWSDGTIRNGSASSDLFVTSAGMSDLNVKLAATGTHAFYINAGRKGTVRTVLRDATSGGTLEKQGDGLLTLSAANSYTGRTTIAAGTLALGSAGSLASSPIDVKSGATFDVSAKSGYSIDAGKTLTGSGTIVGDLCVGGIHAPGNSTGVETVKGNYSLLGELQIELAGTTAGTGYDEVLISGSTAYKTTLSGTLSLDWTNFTGSTDATQLWILKNDTAGTLSGAFSNYTNGASLGLHDGRSWCLYYNADAATGNLTGGNDVLISPVPEPATIVLLALFALTAIAWRRKM